MSRKISGRGWRTQVMKEMIDRVHPLKRTDKFKDSITSAYNYETIYIRFGNQVVDICPQYDLNFLSDSRVQFSYTQNYRYFMQSPKKKIPLPNLFHPIPENKK